MTAGMVVLRRLGVAVVTGMLAMAGGVACDADEGAFDGGAGESDGEDEERAEPDPGLFACGLAPVCDNLHFHLDVGSPEAQECAARFIVSGQPGVLTADESIGGSLWETESLVIPLGDGTAIVQDRHRDCFDCIEDDLPWETVTTRICQLEDVSGLTRACGDEDDDTHDAYDAYGCRWNYWGVNAPGLMNCKPAERAYMCDEVEALLGEE